MAAASPPTKYFSFFFTSLLKTVRINIGECVAAAYINLTLTAATKILMLMVLFVPLRDDMISDCCFHENLTKERPFPFTNSTSAEQLYTELSTLPNIDIVALPQLKVSLA